ncbi:MAG: transcriptional repressor NrdR [Armatimonadetes bacterium]|nr:transcriptional repressor NrdR [Armatimonadota bacterium]
MKCPFCGCLDDKVLNSRTAKEGEAVRRRRECLACARRFTTYEQIEEMRLVVVKRDGRREPFDRSKVLRGLTVACEKRPVATDILEDIVDRIERHIVDSNTTEIESMSLGEMAMQELRKVDKVAYVRFASVYRQFEDIGQFRTIIDGLGDRSAQRKPIKR